jgi:hypothetical protein
MDLTAALASCSRRLEKEMSRNGKRLWEARHEREAARFAVAFDLLEARLRTCRPVRPGRRSRLSSLADPR